jgi:arginyl-tRNA--protein-N-Asp/Glu arginylyltransferase
MVYLKLYNSKPAKSTMRVISEPSTSLPCPCPYLAGQEMRVDYFFASDVSASELDALLSTGWRKFGEYYFRPDCPGCQACVPLRIPVATFRPTKSQRRTIRHCAEIGVRFVPLEYRNELYEVYRDHSYNRFGRETSPDEFRQSFFEPSCPALQSEYYRGNELIGVGFVDISKLALSSVYFAFRPQACSLGLGTFSVCAEIEHARSHGLAYYYLGYCISGNRHMAYKSRFGPHETYDWSSTRWSGDRLKSEIVPQNSL